jgi:hypothetical protein
VVGKRLRPDVERFESPDDDATVPRPVRTTAMKMAMAHGVGIFFTADSWHG